LSPSLRRWDKQAAGRADIYAANSRVVQERICEAYGIAAHLVPAPHGVNAEGPQDPLSELLDWQDGYLLIVSRLMPYKNVDVAIEAVRGRTDRLVIVGDGPLRETVVDQTAAQCQDAPRAQ